MSEVIRYGAGGVPYKAPAAPEPKKEEAEPKVEVEVKISEEETPDAELAKLGLTNDENV
jgi:hypothetical protein|tara:strand:- start:1621 stop:1797 length:177 start_codon:yes stop_codon:yes gene_type:complete